MNKRSAGRLKGLSADALFSSAPIWLSMSHGRDVCYIGVMMTTDSAPAAVERYFRSVESILARYDSRPHWAKVTYRAPEDFARSYSQWSRFIAVRDDLDPDDTFGNDFLDRVFGARRRRMTIGMR